MTHFEQWLFLIQGIIEQKSALSLRLAKASRQTQSSKIRYIFSCFGKERPEFSRKRFHLFLLRKRSNNEMNLKCLYYIDVIITYFFEIF